MTGTVGKFISNFVDVILQPIAELLLVVAVVVFLWGIFEFIKGADNETTREEGKSHMLWGLVGIFIMISAIPIINVALKTFGISTKEVEKTNLKLEKGTDINVKL